MNSRQVRRHAFNRRVAYAAGNIYRQLFTEIRKDWPPESKFVPDCSVAVEDEGLQLRIHHGPTNRLPASAGPVTVESAVSIGAR